MTARACAYAATAHASNAKRSEIKEIGDSEISQKMGLPVKNGQNRRITGNALSRVPTADVSNQTREHVEVALDANGSTQERSQPAEQHVRIDVQYAMRCLTCGVLYDVRGDGDFAYLYPDAWAHSAGRCREHARARAIPYDDDFPRPEEAAA